jgi:adenosylcobinamide-GDP ribazoletransferase
MTGVSAGGFFRALSFLTRLPVPKRFVGVSETGDPPPLEVFWIPVVGAAVGAVLALSSILLSRFFVLVPPAHSFVSAFLLLILWIFMTGALHLDGLADTAECAFSEVPPHEKRRIRKDPRKGVYAIVALNLAILAKWVGIISLLSSPVSLFLAPLLSRGALVPVFRFLARSAEGKGEGLGGLLLPGPSTGFLRDGALAGLLLALAAAGLAGGGKGAGAGVVTLVAMAVLGRSILPRIDGLSGDLAGLLIEAGEIFFLFAMVFLG